MPRFAVDVDDVVLGLLRAGLDPGVTVMSRIPDRLPDYVPLVVAYRSGGSSNVPSFYDEPLLQVHCWVAPTPAQPDARRAGSDLADAARGVLYRAWFNQTVVPGAGHIVSYYESSGPLEVGDENLPSFGRFVASYRIKIRPARQQ